MGDLMSRVVSVTFEGGREGGGNCEGDISEPEIMVGVWGYVLDI